MRLSKPGRRVKLLEPEPELLTFDEHSEKNFKQLSDLVSKSLSTLNEAVEQADREQLLPAAEEVELAFREFINQFGFYPTTNEQIVASSNPNFPI